LKYFLRTVILVALTQISIVAFGQRDFNIELLSQVSHGNILTNDVWGYTDSSGTEYGVVGTRNEAIIYDLSDPRSPQEIGRVPGVSSVWRDFKSNGNFIYQTTDQGADGLTVIDMTNAPDTITSYNWTPTLELGGNSATLNRCHNLWIDDQGLAYLAGCNISNRGVLIIDITTDPYSPTLIGSVDERYAHDVITRDTFLYASEINDGVLAIYSIADISDPKLLSLTPTSSNFTHNAWYSDDGQYIFTTDERSRSFMDVYDISDPQSPQRISMYQPSAKSVVPHNVHYLNGFIVASWYSEGLIILDAHRPDNIVRVGQYDTHPQNDQGSDGCWGAYPYFDSGIITVGDINSGFFVFQPTYQKAAYLEGTVLEAGSLQPINNAQLQLLDIDKTTKNTDATGEFKTGTVDTGLLQVVSSHPEYSTDTFSIIMNSGEVNNKSFFLKKRINYVASGVVKSTDGNPIANATVKFKVEETTFSEKTNDQGAYTIPLFGGQSEILVAAWGYKGNQEFININDNIQREIILEEGYEDDFFADLGWTVSGNATKGVWERGIPIPTTLDNVFANPNSDLSIDLGDMCYITGNQSPTASVDDVDDGSTILTSPEISLENYNDPVINLSTWFYNGGGSSAINDTMHIALISSGDTIRTNSIVYITNGQTDWSEPIEIRIKDHIVDADIVQIEITVSDLPTSGHLVEGGIDAFLIKEADTTTPTYNTKQELSLTISPNPVKDILNYKLEYDEKVSKVQIIGMNGTIWRISPTTKKIDVSKFPAGVYQIHLWTELNQYSNRFVKM